MKDLQIVALSCCMEALIIDSENLFWVKLKTDYANAFPNLIDIGPGAFGGKMKDLTPNIDRIANASVRFKNAYVNSAICMPSRGIIATGRYGFNSHNHGFFHAPDSIPTLMAMIK